MQHIGEIIKVKLSDAGFGMCSKCKEMARIDEGCCPGAKVEFEIDNDPSINERIERERQALLQGPNFRRLNF